MTKKSLKDNSKAEKRKAQHSFRDSLENFKSVLSDMGAPLGMPPLEGDEDLKTMKCPDCGWVGPGIYAIFKDVNFYCPECSHLFLPPKSD